MDDNSLISPSMSPGNKRPLIAPARHYFVYARRSTILLVHLCDSRRSTHLVFGRYRYLVPPEQVSRVTSTSHSKHQAGTIAIISFRLLSGTLTTTFCGHTGRYSRTKRQDEHCLAGVWLGRLKTYPFVCWKLADDSAMIVR